eukprot:CAMPEP_0201510954 /NCGR_PEP_ID=MMETSP0161_2-20130828/3459_1 /ASSEMBLY_ACC=CAM_ASM_000251 /TAXON_ID=180227 /ORGANISM="Neoparamoeba aestuarina, Strain SoJaBio B1-5/56/2" /LENGTH=365 /DNA_ID=CAMNT_0047906245 /DNA_START=117 /DNA_END=1211 /DNA_ORIENTATION=+
MADEPDVVVIDAGTRSIKAGKAGDDTPQIKFPSVLGKSPKVGIATHDPVLGWEAESKAGVLEISCPFEHGIVTDWDDFQRLLHSTYYEELRLDPAAHPLLISESPRNSKEDRQKLAEILFEDFNIPGLVVQNTSVLALYATGRTTGMMIDIGEGGADLVPIYEGFKINHLIQRTEVGGRVLTEYMKELMNKKGDYHFQHYSDNQLIREMKKKYCYVAYDFEQEEECFPQNDAGPKSYELPDGQVIDVLQERFRCAEALFNPENAGKSCLGIHTACENAIKKTDIEMRRYLYGNLVLSGGSSMFPGISDRFQKEIQRLAPSTTSCKVIAPPERYDSTWIGGSIYGSLSFFNENILTKEEYQERGSN